MPVPLQTGAAVKVDPEQLAAPQVVPATRGVQVPAFPAALQVTHWPVQALSQQTPSTQKPLPQPAAARASRAE